MIKISKSLSHMETILSYVLEPYAFDKDNAQNAPVDLFDNKGRLLVTKGESISSEIFGLAKQKELYTLHSAVKCQDGSCEVNLISMQYMLEACKTLKDVMAGIKDDLPLAKQFEQLRVFDKSIYEHSRNVALLAYIIGKKIYTQPERLQELTLGALLHDFGKLSISLAILNKPGHLTSEEYEIIKNHPELGVKKLAGVSLPPIVIDGIAKHHERWNGRGYPNGLCGNEIPLNAQIIAVADVFDAITANRPYRPGMPPYHALEMLIRGMDADFSPLVVKAFANLLSLYPENSWVTLNTGEVGTVTGVNLEYPTRPTIRLLYDKYGQPINGIFEVNLSEDKERFVCKIKYMQDRTSKA